jgi:hypothetical protein
MSMEPQTTQMRELIAEEAARYLSVVTVFRSLGCEPNWRPESQAIACPPALLDTDRRKR